MTLSKLPYKGARDFYPEDKRKQDYLFSTMRQVVRSFGYEEYDAPILEPLELYLAKSSEEIVNEQTYSFEDRGNRKVVIRPEMTPTVSRMVAGRRQELGYPLRWYSIPNLWRYERPQKGRLREHWQLNVDIFGVASLSAEHELIQIANEILKKLGADPSMYVFKINSRKLVNHMLTNYFGMNEEQALKLVRLIDHINKMDYDEFSEAVEKLLSVDQINHGLVDKILDVLASEGIDDLPKDLSSHSSVKELKELFSLLDASSIGNYVFDISLMRGFDYYTDIVFEVYDTDPENSRSMFGGGRYDGLVGMFGVDPVPTVGFGLGDVILQDFVDAHSLGPNLENHVDVYAILIGDVYKDSLDLFIKLRNSGINLAVDSSNNKLDKQLKTALKKNAKKVLFIGEEELKTGKYKLKDLVSNTEKTLTTDELVDSLK